MMPHGSPEQLPTEMAPDDRTPPSPPADPSPGSPGAGPSLSRTPSSSRLNAQAPEFVPRTPPAGHAPGRMEPRAMQIHRGPPPPPVMHVFHPPPAFHHVPVVQNQFEYYGGGGGGYREHEVAHAPADADPESAATSAARDALFDDVIQKITNQVEYYFSDINLATTEHLMRIISKDPDGFVPISVIAGFKKIKALISNNAQLATALRTSSKLVVSDDGKKVRRYQPFTEADLEEMQSRIVVAENLPEDHCYQNLVKVFSVVGSVKTIRTCYPQTTNGVTSATSKPGKMDMFLGNKLHAFVEYETVEEAEKAVVELNDEKNWRSGLRVRLLPRCMTKFGQSRRKVGYEGEGIGDDNDVSTSNQHHEKHFDDSLRTIEASLEHISDDGYHDKEGGARRGRGRGRGAKGRGRGQCHPSSNYRVSGYGAATQPSGHPAPAEQPTVTKQLPGPRMPNGTRGFTMGRGKVPCATQ
uniref:La-related protein 7 n=1 Tax=Anthurium amnicola TaxID=1678845 RepID=A0A1D1ZE07_9ARAE